MAPKTKRVTLEQKQKATTFIAKLMKSQGVTYQQLYPPKREG